MLKIKGLEKLTCVCEIYLSDLWSDVNDDGGARNMFNLEFYLKEWKRIFKHLLSDQKYKAKIKS